MLHFQSQGPAWTEELGVSGQQTADSNHDRSNNGVPDPAGAWTVLNQSIIDHSSTLQVACRGSTVGHVQALWELSRFNAWVFIVDCRLWAGMSFTQSASLYWDMHAKSSAIRKLAIASAPILLSAVVPDRPAISRIIFCLPRRLCQASPSSPVQTPK